MGASTHDGIGEDDMDRAISWVETHDFLRIALQFPDHLLASAVHVVVRLQKGLPGRQVFVLGDSTYGSSSVNEVGAEHYGADCIVHIGPSDLETAATMPVLFVFGRAPVTSVSSGIVAAALQGDISAEGAASARISSLLLVCDVTLQHAADGLVASLAAALAQGVDSVWLAEPQTEGHCDSSSSTRLWHDWRFGSLPVSAWWASLGTLTLAACARPDTLRVCGREVRSASDRSKPSFRRLPEGCGIVYAGTSGSALERRLLLRHGHGHPIWRLDTGTAGCGDDASAGLTRLSCQALLLQRYRFVELARSSEAFGLLLCTSGATQQGKQLAERLEVLLRRAGRRVYRFLIGQPSAEKLGNFPEVDCYVSLAGPENFPYNVRDLPVPIVSPYEVEVALGVRAWEGEYITDAEELLTSGAPAALLPIAKEALEVQTLGPRGRIMHFSQGGDRDIHAMTPVGSVGVQLPPGQRPKPAVVEAGLHGVPSQYFSEPMSKH